VVFSIGVGVFPRPVQRGIRILPHSSSAVDVPFFFLRGGTRPYNSLCPLSPDPRAPAVTTKASSDASRVESFLSSDHADRQQPFCFLAHRDPFATPLFSEHRGFDHGQALPGGAQLCEHHVSLAACRFFPLFPPPGSTKESPYATAKAFQIHPLVALGASSMKLEKTPESI